MFDFDTSLSRTWHQVREVSVLTVWLLFYLGIDIFLDYTAVSALLLRLSLYYEVVAALRAYAISSRRCCRFGDPFSFFFGWALLPCYRISAVML